jgi:hypothetical protein
MSESPSDERMDFFPEMEPLSSSFLPSTMDLFALEAQKFRQFVPVDSATYFPELDFALGPPTLAEPLSLNTLDLLSEPFPQPSPMPAMKPDSAPAALDFGSDILDFLVDQYTKSPSDSGSPATTTYNAAPLKQECFGKPLFNTMDASADDLPQSRACFEQSFVGSVGSDQGLDVSFPDQSLARLLAIYGAPTA